MNLEGKQKVIESKMKMQIGLPVMTLQEIIALALGYEPKEIGLQYHIINLNEFLRDFHFL
jgi:succinate dehydrogenase / fumarate reductase cytochrome b subunit